MVYTDVSIALDQTVLVDEVVAVVIDRYHTRSLVHLFFLGGLIFFLFHWFLLETSETQDGKGRHGATRGDQAAHAPRPFAHDVDCLQLLPVLLRSSSHRPSKRQGVSCSMPAVRRPVQLCPSNVAHGTLLGRILSLRRLSKLRVGKKYEWARRRPECTASGTRCTLSISAAVASHEALPPRDTTLVLTAFTAGLPRPPPVGTQPYLK